MPRIDVELLQLSDALGRERTFSLAVGDKAIDRFKVVELGSSLSTHPSGDVTVYKVHGYGATAREALDMAQRALRPAIEAYGEMWRERRASSKPFNRTLAKRALDEKLARKA